MKKHLFLVAIIGFGVATLCSCGSNSTNTVTGANGEVYNNYQEALNDEDFEAAHKFLSYLYSEYEKTVENTDFGSSSSSKKIKAKAVAYSTAANNVYSGELRFLASSNDSLMWEKCILFLRELPIIGIKYPSQKKLSSIETWCLTECYQNYVTLRNSLCNLLLDLAIEKEKKEIANKAIQCFVENCKIEDPGGLFADTYVYYDNDDINAAKKKLEESFPETKSKKKRR